MACGEPGLHMSRCGRIETQTFGEMHQTGCCYCCCKWYSDIEFTKKFKWKWEFPGKAKDRNGLRDWKIVSGDHLPYQAPSSLCCVCVCLCLCPPLCLPLPQVSPSPPTLIFPTANRIFLQGVGGGGVIQKIATEQRTLGLPSQPCQKKESSAFS